MYVYSLSVLPLSHAKLSFEYQDSIKPRGLLVCVVLMRKLHIVTHGSSMANLPLSMIIMFNNDFDLKC